MHRLIEGQGDVKLRLSGDGTLHHLGQGLTAWEITTQSTGTILATGHGADRWDAIAQAAATLGRIARRCGQSASQEFLRQQAERRELLSREPDPIMRRWWRRSGMAALAARETRRAKLAQKRGRRGKTRRSKPKRR